MSLGIGGICRKFDEDKNCIIYEYLSYDLDVPEFRNDERIFDGIILIDRNCLIEPEIRKKIRRMPNGKRKAFRKIIFRDFDIFDCINSGKIKIENCSNAFKFLPDGIDHIAVRLCNMIFKYYQENGALPIACSYSV